MVKFNINKKGYSTGFGWLVGIIILFTVGLLYIMFNQVIVGNLVPAIDTQSQVTMNETQIAEMNANNTRFLSYWAAVPLILLLIIVIFVVINSMAPGNGGQ